MKTPVAPKDGGGVRSSGGQSAHSPSAPSSAAVSTSSSSAAKRKVSPSDKVTSQKCVLSEQDVITLDSDGEECETPKKTCKKIPRNDDDDDDIMELPAPPKSDNKPSTLKNCIPTAVEKEKSPVSAQPDVSQVSLRTEGQDVEMTEAVNGPQPDVLLPSKASEPMDLATVTSGVEKASISNTTTNVPEARGDGLSTDEKEETPQTPVVQTPAKSGPSDEAKPKVAKHSDKQPGPSGSRPNSGQQQAGNAKEVAGDGNDENGYEEDEDDGDAQDDDDETEEEPVDEDGIPLANIAKLTPDELRYLQKLKVMLKEYQQRLRNLDEYVLPSNISDEEYKFFLKKLNEARNLVADCAEAICKICKVKDEDYDKEILTFKFSGSGNGMLDKFVTIWVLRMIRPEFGGSLDVEVAKNLEDSPIGDFTDLKLQSVRRLIKVLARSRLNGSTIPHRVHGRPIRADDVFQMLMEDIKYFRALVYNRLVVPKYTLGNTDMQSLHNPRLPKDPELLKKLKRNTRTNLHAATLEVVEKFEERLIRQGVQVARRGPNDRGPDPSHSDDEHDSDDYTDAERDDEEGGDVEMKDETQPSVTVQAAAVSAGEKLPQPIVSGASARPDSAGVKRKDPDTPKEPEGPVAKKKDGSPTEERVAGGELHEAKIDGGCMANVLPVDVSELKRDETDDDDEDGIDDAEGLEALLSEIKDFPTN
ncbi:hypothetical protein RvY_00805 [Ramazzottius varieornatus]|uniref:Uncharacterized protein n=1 Tax=Ramazzottius varieornatus TaxID=947166 RepID=A0A1D1UE20_RAMVA|nr:hypothetical protein RvY_00805 [Ramazzottius varieornatus]